MKNLKITITAISLIAIATACKMKGRHTIITEGDGANKLKIEYYGHTLFNYDSTAIARITPNGSVKYINNDQEFIAENGRDGQIIYRFNGGEKQTNLNADEEKFLAEAVKVMIKHGHNNNTKDR